MERGEKISILIFSPLFIEDHWATAHSENAKRSNGLARSIISHKRLLRRNVKLNQPK